jgi:hypothetical protein
MDIDSVDKNTDNMNKYVGVMAEMKRRTDVIGMFLSGERNAVYKASNIETIGLQFRKVFELIAFASLTAHKELYSAVYSDFAKHWEAAKLVNRLRQINPRFYPEPVIQVPSDKLGLKTDLVPRRPDYLTEESLVDAHGRCGSLMHAANPYAREIDYGFFEASFPDWLTNTVNLLNAHLVHLPGDTGFYLLQMGREDYPSWTPFALASTDKNAEV